MDISTLKKLFWDIDESALPSLSKETIISRTLSHGTFLQIKDLFSLYTAQVIRAVFVQMKKDSLTDRRRAFFALILR